MQFGLWFEPEMINLDSDLARRHPEWIMAARDELPVESRAQHVLNLAAPGAYAHVKGQMLALLDEYAIDYIKWDHNRDLTEAGDRGHGGRPVVHEQTLAFYRLLRELKEAHPTLEIESCSSGGGRVDLGVLELTDRIWVSDNSDPHDRQSMMRWTAQLAPPEYLGAHIASDRSHTTGRRLDLSFRASTAIFGHLGIEWDLGEATDAELGVLSRWIAFHKEHRALLLGGQVVRVDTPDPRIVVHGVVARDGSEATVLGRGPRHDAPRSARAPEAARPRPRPHVPGRTRLHRHAAVRVSSRRRGGASRATQRCSRRRSTGTAPSAADVSFSGARLRGDVLATVGVASPRLHPDQAVLYRVVADD